jgi:Putative prokaryotic signal transducing protein
MVVITSTNDLVRLTFLVSLLRNGGFQPVLYDENMAAVEGSIGAVMRRIAVPDDQANAALRYLRAADEL